MPGLPVPTGGEKEPHEASIEAIVDALGGLGPGDPNAGQMLLRTLIVYAVALMIVRLGEKRFVGKNTAFDLVLSIILGSVISRAINGGAPFLNLVGQRHVNPHPLAAGDPSPAI